MLICFILRSASLFVHTLKTLNVPHVISNKFITAKFLIFYVCNASFHELSAAVFMFYLLQKLSHSRSSSSPVISTKQKGAQRSVDIYILKVCLSPNRVCTYRSILWSKGSKFCVATAVATYSLVSYSKDHIDFIVNYRKLDVMSFRGIHSKRTLKTNFLNIFLWHKAAIGDEHVNRVESMRIICLLLANTIPYQLVQSVVTFRGHFTTRGSITVTWSQFHTKAPQILGSITVTWNQSHTKDPQILGSITVTWSQFHTKDPQILGSITMTWSQFHTKDPQILGSITVTWSQFHIKDPQILGSITVTWT